MILTFFQQSSIVARMFLRLIFIVLLLNSALVRAETPVVAVAANMTHVMTEVADQYQAKTGKQIKLTFGSSGNFTRQIQQAAPYTLFLSADKKYVDILTENNLTDSKAIAFARGEIGILIPNRSVLSDATDIRSIFQSLIYGQYRKIAIANPETAPYGAAAMQALQSGGLWATSSQKTLIAENAAQVVQYGLTGSVDLAIIPSSFAIYPGLSGQGKFYPIPPSWHDPIDQYLVLLKGAGKSTRAFLNYLSSEAVKDIIKKYGYSLPNNH